MVGLVDVDGHNFPNLALMKLSAWYKKQGEGVEFASLFGVYDIIYKSKVFTWTSDDVYHYNTDNHIRGGTGYDVLSILPDDVDTLCPDYSLYNCESAYGFLTRGCPNKCWHCQVPWSEGDIRPYMDIDDFLDGKSSAVLMDNNVLACDHGLSQIEKIASKGIVVDFNQGLDSYLIDEHVAKLLSRVKWMRFIRLALDSKAGMKYVESAVKLLRRYTEVEIFCYMIVTGDIQDALERAEFLRRLGVDPFAQAYRCRFGEVPITREQNAFCRWVNRKQLFKSVVWKDYTRKKYAEEDKGASLSFGVLPVPVPDVRPTGHPDSSQDSEHKGE